MALRNGRDEWGIGDIQKFARPARLDAVPRRASCGRPITQSAMCAVFGDGQKTVDARCILLREMARMYMYIPGVSTIGGRRVDAPSAVEVDEASLRKIAEPGLGRGGAHRGGSGDA